MLLTEINSENLIGYLRASGTGSSKLVTIAEVFSDCETVEQFLEQLASEVSAMTLDKVKAYLETNKSVVKVPQVVVEEAASTPAEAPTITAPQQINNKGRRK